MAESGQARHSPQPRPWRAPVSEERKEGVRAALNARRERASESISGPGAAEVAEADL